MGRVAIPTLGGFDAGLRVDIPVLQRACSLWVEPRLVRHRYDSTCSSRTRSLLRRPPCSPLLSLAPIPRAAASSVVSWNGEGHWHRRGEGVSHHLEKWRRVACLEAQQLERGPCHSQPVWCWRWGQERLLPWELPKCSLGSPLMYCMLYGK